MRKFTEKFVSGMLSLTLAAGSFVSCVVASGAVDVLKYGDINGDSAVNSIDALAVLNYSVGSATLTEDAVSRADVNADGRVDSSDALDILKYSVGMIDSFKAEKSDKTDETIASFNRALVKASDELPSYILKERVKRSVDDIDLSGAATLLIPSSKLREMEEQAKKDYSADRVYTRVVKQKSEDSSKRMIPAIDLSDISIYKSVSGTETADGKYILTIAFKDEKDPKENSPIVRATGLGSYDDVKKEFEEADGVEGAKSTVNSLAVEYKNCTLKCEIDKNSDELLSVQWSADILSESKVTTAGLVVWMKSSGARGAEYLDFGY